MTMSKILGLAIGVSLLFGYEPVAEATPMAVPPSAVDMSASNGLVIQQARVYHGVARRTTRRHVRRRVR